MDAEVRKVTVSLAERDGRTEMMFHQGIFTSLEARDGHGHGWNSCFERLTELLRAVEPQAVL